MRAEARRGLRAVRLGRRRARTCIRLGPETLCAWSLAPTSEVDAQVDAALEDTCENGIPAFLMHGSLWSRNRALDPDVSVGWHVPTFPGHGAPGGLAGLEAGLR